MKRFTNTRPVLLTVCLFLLFPLKSCRPGEKEPLSIDEIYKLFRDPPPGSRPYARWWWNGDCIEIDELERELDVMRTAGIGGVEVNPIAHPLEEGSGAWECYEWLSPEWNERFAATVDMAREREMTVDLIMGSGWPFGGEFLKEDQLLQGIGLRKMTLNGPGRVSLVLSEVWQLPGRNFGSYNNPDASEPELFFLRMIPQGAKGIVELADLMDLVDEQGRIVIPVPEGRHDLYIGSFQKAYRQVMHGAPGSKGPVVDHYDEEDVRAYMDRLGGTLTEVLGGKLGDHIRALFCDSIELSGANITDDLMEEFRKRRGYSLEPWLPLVYYHPYQGYTDTLQYAGGFISDIRRVRYDFNKTLVELFLERFTGTFDRWANEHGMMSRYQAYGMPWLVGMLDGYRMVDIPESNNWLYSANAKAHGYWIWNKYASSAAHLSGSRLVSCEAMTNTRGVFRMTLNMLKKNDDFNFITGINHSVLHGFNYSPPESGFPGWVRYGAYFSDQNTWWPYFRHWTDYNARLSTLFQHAEPVVDVAILTPEADIWRLYGLVRYPFYMNPWYHHDLWEGFSRLGITADYINEGVIRRAEAQGKRMVSEHCSYQLVIVSSATAIEPATAEAIRKLAAHGVKFLFLEQMPSESPAYFEKEKNDQLVREQMKEAGQMDNVYLADPPGSDEEITDWAGETADRIGIRSAITIQPASEKLYVTKYRLGKSGIFFFSNQDDRLEMEFSVALDQTGMTPWRWDPETGQRQVYPLHNEGSMEVRLQPLESLLIVLEEKGEGTLAEIATPDNRQYGDLVCSWEIEFHPFVGEPFHISSDELFDFATHADQRITNFAGQVRYTGTFNPEGARWDYLDLGPGNHVTEVFLNKAKLGTRWWGRHLYHLDPHLLKEGENRLEILYTTTLANYANSLEDNPVAKKWIHMDHQEEMGLHSRIRLLGSR